MELILQSAYIAFLDDDDFWMEDKLSIQINKMQEKIYHFQRPKVILEMELTTTEDYELYNNEKFYKKLKKSTRDKFIQK